MKSFLFKSQSRQIPDVVTAERWLERARTSYDWLKELCEEIEELKNGDEIANVYLCKNNEYQHFI